MASADYTVTLAGETDERVVIALSGRITADVAASVEREIGALRAGRKDKGVLLDARSLDYISSAGLRVLMRLKREVEDLVIEEVSPEVYEVFSMTGFSELMEVRRRLRDVSLEGAELLGAGGNGQVWRLDPETIVKVYNEGTSLEKIARENECATAAFKAGLPCAIAFDTVRVGERYGIVFELLEAETVGRIVRADPSRVPEMARAMGGLLREMHSTVVPQGTLPRMADKVSEWIDYLACAYGEWVGPSDIAMLREIADAIPDTGTVIHNDFHEGNVMCQGGELVLIDLDDVCTGNPVFDLLNHYMGHVVAQHTPEILEHSMSLTPELALAMYRQTLVAYFGSEERVAQHEQAMQAAMLFSLMLYPAKSKDSKNLTPERAQIIFEQQLPVLRQLAPVVKQVMGSYR